MKFNDFSYVNSENNKLRNNADFLSSSWAGKKLKSVLYFLAIPVIFLLFPTVLGLGLPKILMYIFVVIYGLILAFKSFRDPEYLLAIFILYMPLSKMIPVSLLPNINGTNILLLLCFLAWAIDANQNNKPMFRAYPMTLLMSIWGGITCFS